MAARAPGTGETVLVTTHDLPLAGELREGFRHAGYRVALFTAPEDPSETDDPVLLVLTGGARTEVGKRHAAGAAALGLPVFAVVAPDERESVPPEVTTTFTAPADPEEIVLVGTRAIERKRLRRATGIVGETDAMVEVLERIVQIAPVDATVLITGESGTGKELVARGLHALSRRRHRTFIPVNVAALSETLLESELFGHEKGSFTGAIDTRKGLFELASGGTIFLDEIGEMPPQTQTKLLRILEQQEFHRVGGQKLIQVNVRILAATNQRLDQLVVSGDFRKDLYYRLNILTISLPPLRERREDIPRLVEAFVREAAERHDRGPFRGISPEAMEILLRHRWPGNVRELRNLIESMVVLAPGREIRPEDIPADLRSGERSRALVPVGTAPARAGGDSVQALRPQLEFIFRTMMEMKVDIEDLRREFEAFQSEEQGGSALIVHRPGGEIVQHPPSADRSDPSAAEAPAAGEPLPAGEVPASGENPVADEIPVKGEPLPAGELPVMGDTPVASDIPAASDAPAASGTPLAPASPAGDLPAADPTTPSADPSPPVTYRPGMTLDDVEREVIGTVLDSVAWNRRRAAELLGIAERTLYRKVKRYGLEEDQPGEAGN